MILFIGQVASDQRDREAFQEVDYRQMFGPGTLGFAKWVGEMRRRRPPARVRRARLPRRDAGPARAGRAGAARGHADDADRARRCCRASSRRSPRRRPRRCASCASCCWPPSGRSSSPAAAAGRRGVRGAASASPSAGSCRSAAPSASRTCSTTAIRTTPATSASASIRSSRRASREADLMLAIGPRLGEMTTGGYELLAPPRPTQQLVHIHAGAEELGRVYAGRPADQRVDGLRGAGAGDARRRRATLPLGARGRARRTPTTRPTCVPHAGRAARHGRGRADASSATLPRRHDLHQRRRQLRRLAAPLLPLRRPAPRRPHAARADLGRDGLRRAGRRRGGAARAASAPSSTSPATATS